jgi:hypothetical protein
VVGAYGTALVPTILILIWVEEGLQDVFDPFNLLMLLLFVTLTSLAFTGSLFLVRPHVHINRWAPYALAAASGAMTVITWRAISWLHDHFMSGINLGWTLDVISFVAGWVVVSFCTGIIMLWLYRVVIDQPDRDVKTVELTIAQEGP